MNGLHKSDDWFAKNDSILLNWVCFGECRLKCWICRDNHFRCLVDGGEGVLIPKCVTRATEKQYLAYSHISVLLLESVLLTVACRMEISWFTWPGVGGGDEGSSEPNGKRTCSWNSVVLPPRVQVHIVLLALCKYGVWYKPVGEQWFPYSPP
jgi:hypothetical protein